MKIRVAQAGFQEQAGPGWELQGRVEEEVGPLGGEQVPGQRLEQG